MAIEIVVFSLQTDSDLQAFQAAIDETTTVLKTQKGFQSRTVGQSESGEWLDILYWDSVADGKNAVSVFQTDEAGKRFSAFFDPQSVKVYYLDT